MIFDLLWHKTEQNVYFWGNKNIFFPKKKRYQVIYKCILTAIGQKIPVTVPQSCNVAGRFINPWRLMGRNNFTFYNTIPVSFNWLLFMIKWFNYEIITYYFQILLISVLKNSSGSDPDWDFWLDPDPDSIEYGSETLCLTLC